MPGRTGGAAGGLLPAFCFPALLFLTHLFQHRFALFIREALAAGGNDAVSIGFRLGFGLGSRFGMRQRGALHLGDSLFDLGTGSALRRHLTCFLQHFFGDMGNDQRFGMFFPLTAVIPVL